MRHYETETYETESYMTRLLLYVHSTRHTYHQTYHTA